MTILAALGGFALGAAAMWGAQWVIDWLFFAPIDPVPEQRDLGPDGYRALPLFNPEYRPDGLGAER